MKTTIPGSVLVGLILFFSASCGSTEPNRPVSTLTVVPHEKLLEFLPALDGWTRETTPQGTTDTSEKVSRVQVGYNQVQGMGGLGIELMDTTMNVNILAPLRAFITANRAQTSGNAEIVVTTTPTEVLGFRGMQEWTPGPNNGTLSLLVADRFTVGITANSVSGPDVMRKVAESIDLKKLAALK